MLTVDSYLNRAERKQRNTIDEYINRVENANFATLSMGGNDVGFFNILNACAYAFYGPFSGSCEEAIEFAELVVASDEFATGYSAALDLLLEKGDSPSFRVLATGYSAFFDDALTDDCDEYSLSYWPGWWKKTLTVDIRSRINNICKKLNAKIGQIINARSDDRVIWVDWAWRFDDHRFCQPGKPPIDGENTWFFDVDFREFMPNGDIDIETCEQEALMSGDWNERAACGIAIVQAKFPNETLRGAGNDVDTQGGRRPFAPSTARLFHPTARGYAAIVEEIRLVWPYY
ncbi:esterase family protein [Arthroderma uncinatum]|uniref:esterase family protein n=1 Tax=Arthroderma uncinatum TaxID=74035 RepID=UPI00144A752C|nr:esterase family protein [Arthroderma uncinatum]KAF3479912.1 esterase family protein [Arthroderma uncinatum]